MVQVNEEEILGIWPENHLVQMTVRPNQEIPHSLDRKTIESAIGDHGYQLWRLKKQPA